MNLCLRLAFRQTVYPDVFHRGRCEPARRASSDSGQPLQLTPFRGGPVRHASPFGGEQWSEFTRLSEVLA